MDIRSFRDLKIWQRSMDLVDRIYELTSNYPKEEMFGLAAQMRRSAVSIPSNIAEGHIRKHSNEFRQFLYVALGSLAELETQLQISLRQKYVLESQHKKTLAEILEIGKMIRALAKKLTPNP